MLYWLFDVSPVLYQDDFHIFGTYYWYHLDSIPGLLDC